MRALTATPRACTAASRPSGSIDPADLRIDPDRLLAHVRALNAWYAGDEQVTLTPEYVSRLLRDAGDPLRVLRPDAQ